MNDRQRGKKGQQRRRRSSGGNRGGNYQNVPRGPVMTAIGESTYEAVFDHGGEGYGVWFDGMVRDDPVYRQHWKGNRPIYVKLEEDRIVITRDRPGSGSEPDTDAGTADAQGVETVPELGDAKSNGSSSIAEAGADAEEAPKRRTTRRRVTIDDDTPAASSDELPTEG